MAKATKKKMKDEQSHPSHTEDLIRLRRIKGQIEGVERMIGENRYCMDIVTQIRSIMAALRSTEGLVMERHLRHCVADAINAHDQRKTEEKISELITLFQKR